MCRFKTRMFGVILTSPIYSHGRGGYLVGATYTAKNDGGITEAKDIGFHVFVHKSDAEHRVANGESHHVLVKVRVSGFNKSGGFGVMSQDCETWNKMTILEVYNQQGKNITYRCKRKGKK